MRAETLFRAIGEVDEAMLQDAVTAAARPPCRRKPQAPGVVRRPKTAGCPASRWRKRAARALAWRP